MSGWSQATLSQNEVAGPGLHRLTLEVQVAVSSGFHTAGQYHRVRLPSGQDASFAIASPPGAARFEYLVRASAGVAGELTALAPGAQVEVSVPMGPGFPVPRARGKNLLVIGTGTGFAPLRSVLLAIAAERAAFGEVHGAYGVLTPAHLAFGRELADWERAGLHIIPTVTASAAGWTGAVGQVQHLVSRLPVERSELAFVCGQNEMVAEITDLLGQRGIPPDRVFVNF